MFDGHPMALLNHLMGIAATTGHLGLAVVVLRRAPKSPLRVPLSLLCFFMSLWSFASGAYELFGGLGWRWLEATSGPLVVPLGLHVVLLFVGRRRRHRVFLLLMYLYFFALSVAGSVYVLMEPGGETSVDSQYWSALFLAGVVVPLIYTVYRLVRHLRPPIQPEERTRTHLILGGLIFGLSLGSTELVDNFFPVVPALGHAGTLLVTVSLTIASLRFRLFDYELATNHWLYATFAALLGVGGYLILFGTSRVAFLVFIAASLVFVIAVGLREMTVSEARRRERLERFATFGRFSAQMAHDLKNPLAALKGALQYVEGELGDENSLDEQKNFMELMGNQVERIEKIVDRYERMSRVEPRRSEIDVGAVLQEVLESARIASEDDVEFSVEIPDDLPHYFGDRQLLTLVFENLVRNAIEAMPNGGEIEVEIDTDWSGDLDVEIRDTGEGMDARELERVFDDFYTTKAKGSGLGLGFCRRVIEAHGGTMNLTSSLDAGTEVRVHLPES